MAGRLDWLFERPIAHRGLHDLALGVVENTPSAVARAIDHGFAVEIDVQETADGEALVFHDDTLDRLTMESGPVRDRTLTELRRVAMRGAEEPLWTLDECVDLVADRIALVVEIKSLGTCSRDHAARVARRIAERSARAAVKSFDPACVFAARAAAPSTICGLIGEAGSHVGLLEGVDFLSWSLDDLDRPAVTTARAGGLPVMSWTVRSAADQAQALRRADQIVFEGFLPAVQNR